MLVSLNKPTRRISIVCPGFCSQATVVPRHSQEREGDSILPIHTLPEQNELCSSSSSSAVVSRVLEVTDLPEGISRPDAEKLFNQLSMCGAKIQWLKEPQGGRGGVGGGCGPCPSMGPGAMAAAKVDGGDPAHLYTVVAVFPSTMAAQSASFKLNNSGGSLFKLRAAKKNYDLRVLERASSQWGRGAKGERANQTETLGGRGGGGRSSSWYTLQNEKNGKKNLMCQMYKREEGVNLEVAGVRFRSLGCFVFTVGHHFCLVFFLRFSFLFVSSFGWYLYNRRAQKTREHAFHRRRAPAVGVGAGAFRCGRGGAHARTLTLAHSLSRRSRLQTTTPEWNAENHRRQGHVAHGRQTHTGQSTSDLPRPRAPDSAPSRLSGRSHPVASCSLTYLYNLIRCSCAPYLLSVCLTAVVGFRLALVSFFSLPPSNLFLFKFWGLNIFI